MRDHNRMCERVNSEGRDYSEVANQMCRAHTTERVFDRERERERKRERVRVRGRERERRLEKRGEIDAKARVRTADLLCRGNTVL